jgi:hypothetical protein
MRNVFLTQLTSSDMENESNNSEQMQNPMNHQAQESEEQQKNDQDFLQHVQESQPDAAKKTDDAEALIGDVDPTDRVETSQEELNAELVNKQSEASKISGEQL